MTACLDHAFRVWDSGDDDTAEVSGAKTAESARECIILLHSYIKT